MNDTPTRPSEEDTMSRPDTQTRVRKAVEEMEAQCGLSPLQRQAEKTGSPICLDCGSMDLETSGPDHQPIYCRDCDSGNIHWPTTPPALRLMKEALMGSRGADQKAIAMVGAELVETLLNKNQDYGSSVLSPPYLLPGLSPTASILCRLSDKVQRLHQLMEREGEVETETLEDTMADLGGYAVLYLVARELNADTKAAQASLHVNQGTSEEPVWKKVSSPTTGKGFFSMEEPVMKEPTVEDELPEKWTPPPAPTCEPPTFVSVKDLDGRLCELSDDMAASLDRHRETEEKAESMSRHLYSLQEAYSTLAKETDRRLTILGQQANHNAEAVNTRLCKLEKDLDHLQSRVSAIWTRGQDVQKMAEALETMRAELDALSAYVGEEWDPAPMDPPGDSHPTIPEQFHPDPSETDGHEMSALEAHATTVAKKLLMKLHSRGMISHGCSLSGKKGTKSGRLFRDMVMDAMKEVW